MALDFYLEQYDPILKQVLKWRALPMPLLKELSDYQGLDTSFRRVITKLEKVSLLKSRPFKGKSKLVYLGPELIKSSQTRVVPLYDESLIHEGVVTMVTNRFLQSGIFKDATLAHEVITSSFGHGIRRLPDAILEGQTTGESFKMALEIELTQKAKTRVRNKVEDYLSNKVFDYIFYIFNDEAVYSSYKKTITSFINSNNNEQRKEAEIRFILGFKKDILHTGINLNELEVFYKGKLTKLSKIFST
jgi:hypothetical protein